MSDSGEKFIGFMSEEEKRTEKARLLLEWVENRLELRRQQTIAKRIASACQGIADAMQWAAKPKGFWADLDSSTKRPRSQRMAFCEADAIRADLNVSTFKELSRAVRQIEERQEELESRLAAFGIDNAALGKAAD